MIGRWIDGLTDEQRDRIVTADGWWHPLRCGLRNPVCLVSAAYGLPGVADALCVEPMIARKYDRYVIRFGTERVVAALKARAGATLPPMATEREAPQATEVAR